MGKDAIYSAQREVRTFVDLDHGAWVLIGKSEKDETGSYYTNMGALLLTACTFEAYLNHLGELTFAFWPRIERIGVLEKYDVLCTHLGVCQTFRAVRIRP